MKNEMRITSISPEKALKWAEEVLEGDEFYDAFTNARALAGMRYLNRKLNVPGTDKIGNRPIDLMSEAFLKRLMRNQDNLSKEEIIGHVRHFLEGITAIHQTMKHNKN